MFAWFRAATGQPRRMVPGRTDGDAVSVTAAMKHAVIGQGDDRSICRRFICVTAKQTCKSLGINHQLFFKARASCQHRVAVVVIRSPAVLADKITASSAHQEGYPPGAVASRYSSLSLSRFRLRPCSPPLTGDCHDEIELRNGARRSFWQPLKGACSEVPTAKR